MAEGFEPSIQHYSADIYKPQHSLLIEEHMFLLFSAETPPHAVEETPPLKGTIVYESHGEKGLRVVLYAHSLFFVPPFFSPLPKHPVHLWTFTECVRDLRS